jgi:hypothetical protein
MSNITPLLPSYYYLDFSLLILTLLSFIIIIILLLFILITSFLLVPLSQILIRLKIVLKNGLKC